MRNMLDMIAPRPEELWERSASEIQTREIDEGRTANVAYFNSKLDKPELVGNRKELVALGGDALTGWRHSYEMHMTKGITREAAAYIPHDIERMVATIHMDTPWFTGMEGHMDAVAEYLMEVTGQAVVLVGPERLKDMNGDDASTVTKLFHQAVGSSEVSLALAAQDSVTIVDFLVQKHGLPRQLIEVGPSRGAMLAPGKHQHALDSELQPVYYDLSDPCIAENIRDDWRNIYRLPMFPIREAPQLVPVALDAIRRRRIHREMATFALPKDGITAALLGTGPAIFSGEAGEFPAQLPAGTPVHLLNLSRNPLGHNDLWHEKYDHTLYASVSLDTAHFGLGYGSIEEHIARRINRWVNEYFTASEDVAKINYKRVHLTDDDAQLGPDEHMPDVA